VTVSVICNQTRYLLSKSSPLRERAQGKNAMLVKKMMQHCVKLSRKLPKVKEVLRSRSERKTPQSKSCEAFRGNLGPVAQAELRCSEETFRGEWQITQPPICYEGYIASSLKGQILPPLSVRHNGLISATAKFVCLEACCA
jgi:hypothetical protein